MYKKKLLITGCSGLLGTNWVKKSIHKYEIYGSYLSNNPQFSNIQTIKCDFRELQSVKKIIKKIKPDFVVNTIGLPSIEQCEKNYNLAFDINVKPVVNLIKAQKTIHNFKLIHISSDHLFDGKNSSYTELDEPKPINNYAKTKNIADTKILSSLSNYLIIRANFYGPGTDFKSSYSELIINKIANNDDLSLSNNIFFNPISIYDLIKYTNKLIDKNITGIFNVSSDEGISKFKFAKTLAKHLKFDKNFIKENNDLVGTVKRPNSMVLSNTKLKNILNIKNIPYKFDKKNTYDQKNIIKSINYGYHHISNNDIEAVSNVLKNGFLTQGPIIDNFEKKIAKYVGSKFAVAVSSCTAGLHIAVKAIDLKKNDKVITTPITFVSTPNSIIYNGGNVIFADIDNQNINISNREIIKITKSHKISAIMPVHFAGYPCDIKQIRKSNPDKFIIEDAAHALGASYKCGAKIGSCKYSDMTVFSFHPVKPITTGEGGVVTTNSLKLYKKLLRIRSHGIIKLDDKNINKKEAFTKGIKNPWYYEMQELGFNYRITDLQCALGISQLDRLDAFIDKRKSLAKIYRNKFKNFKNLELAHKKNFNLSGHHLFIIRINFLKIKLTKAQLMNKLKSYGIGTQVHYIPVPIHPFYKNKGYNVEEYPVSYKYYNEALSIPLFYSLSYYQQEYVISKLRKLVG